MTMYRKIVFVYLRRRNDYVKDEGIVRKSTADRTLEAKFAEIMKDAEQAGEDTTSKKLVGFAKDAGYEVTIDEMKAFFKERSRRKMGLYQTQNLIW